MAAQLEIPDTSQEPELPVWLVDRPFFVDENGDICVELMMGTLIVVDSVHRYRDTYDHNKLKLHVRFHFKQ